MSEDVVRTQNLTKVFEQDKVVDSLNLTVPRGSVFGFLGVNGAGKTTTVRMIMGHLHPSEGEVTLLGRNPWKHSDTDRRRVAYVSDNMHLPGWMTAEHAMRLNASLYPKWNGTLARHLLDELDVHPSKKYQSLSRGEKRRLCLLLAVCQNADVLILDEPASGLDVVARHKFLNLILEQVYDGKRTVFLSSHLLSDLERIIDRLAILHHGRVHLSGALEDLKTNVRQIHLPETVPRESLASHFKVMQYESRENQTVAIVRDFDEARFRALCQQHERSDAAQVHGFNLEDLFVKLVGKG
ncbi:MAG: ABC transporter ATP-binding protein [Candidatus Poribacteria bacterium]|nr:ABC transporter ATP-binding protein [Candidatus Poribacteria bacterium]MDE0503950.1 ABC transporter ATP-binding protein [Candidatus Poribacteria bacterium]